MNKLRRIKLRHLETFVEVARNKSVSRAAEVLHLTQPAVSRTIRELEEICGRPLVEKDGRGIRISNHGEVFLRYAGSSIAAARNGINALSELGFNDGPRIRLGALPTVSATIIPDAVARYLQTGMRNRLKVVTGENSVLLDQLRHGELDLVMGRLPAPEKMQGLLFQPLFRDRVVFTVHATHPLASGRQFAIDDLERFPVVVPNDNSIIRPFVDRLFVEQGIPEPPRAIESVSDSFGRAFVRRHQAVWIISRGVIASELERGEFAILPIDTASTMGSVGLMTRAQSSETDACGLFAEILKRVVSDSGLG